MVIRSWKLAVLTGVLMVGVALVAYADDSDVWNLPDEDGGTQSYQQYQPYQAPTTYGQGYQPYPMPVQQVQMQQPKQSLLGRLLSPILGPITRRMSPPIQQVPKVEKEKAKETPVLKDPLIRLARTIEYDGQRVPAGFYLLSVQSGGGEEGATLTIKRQQQSIMSVPALASGFMVGDVPKTSAEPALPAPPNKMGKPDKNTEPEASALMELADDGQSALLVYQLGGKKYTSRPVSVIP